MRAHQPLAVVGPAVRARQNSAFDVSLEDSVMDCEIGNSLKGADLDFLSLKFPGILCGWSNLGHEIADTMDVVPGKQSPAKSLQVEPFVGRAFDRAVVEIETIDVDIHLHSMSSKSKETAGLAASGPGSEEDRGS